MDQYCREVPSSRWSEACDRHFAIRDAIDRVAAIVIDVGLPVRQRYWGTIAALLLRYEVHLRKSGLSGVKHEADLGPLPLHVVTELTRLTGHIAVGILPKGVRSAGNKAAAPDERNLIGLAVAYRRACRPEGLQIDGRTYHLKDPKPVQTLLTWFGVSKRTMNDWISQREPWVPFVQDVPAGWLANAAWRAGQRYQVIGRSEKAVGRRQRKRSKK
jgi:hypothetical protein